MKLIRGSRVLGVAVGVSACGSVSASHSATSPSTAAIVDTATLSDLGACVLGVRIRS